MDYPHLLILMVLLDNYGIINSDCSKTVQEFGVGMCFLVLPQRTPPDRFELAGKHVGGKNLFLLLMSQTIIIYPRSHVPEVLQIFTALQKRVFSWTNSSVHLGKKGEKLYLASLPLASCTSVWPCFEVRSFYFKRKGQSHASVTPLLWWIGPLLDIAAVFIS